MSAKRVYGSCDNPELKAYPLNAKEEKESRTPFECDYERVLFSSCFRRLAGKTQVRPFADIDYVHNRLTHSIEVAAVCESLARNISLFLLDQDDIEESDCESIKWITKAAGISHDIGNPPYGHAGESAIQEWASNLDQNEMPMFHSSAWFDLKLFDGNAQGFRLLSRPDPRPTSYFHFTCATLGSVVKYPWSAMQARSQHINKFDIFSTEESIFNAVWRELRLNIDGKCVRHPLSFLSEAADDICYRILDFEDAVAMHILQEKDVNRILIGGLESGDKNLFNKYKYPLQWVRAKIIGRLISAFTEQFKKHYDEIMCGTFVTERRKDLRACFDKRCGIGKMLECLDKKYDVLYTEHDKVLNEIGGFHQIPLLLENYLLLLRDMFSNEDRVVPRYKKLSAKSRQLVTLAWGEQYYSENIDKQFAWWLHTILDFVAGMTDGYIAKVSSKLG